MLTSADRTEALATRPEVVPSKSLPKPTPTPPPMALKATLCQLKFCCAPMAMPTAWDAMEPAAAAVAAAEMVATEREPGSVDQTGAEGLKESSERNQMNHLSLVIVFIGFVAMKFDFLMWKRKTASDPVSLLQTSFALSASQLPPYLCCWRVQRSRRMPSPATGPKASCALVMNGFVVK